MKRLQNIMRINNVLVEAPKLKKKKELFENPKTFNSSPSNFSPFYSSSISNPLFNNSNISISNKFNLKPSNSYSVSFEGFSHKEPVKIAASVIKEASELIENHIGESAKKHFELQLSKLRELKDTKASHLLQINPETGEHVFSEKSVGKLLLENVFYPVAQMPLDIVNYFVKTDIPLLKNRREASELEALQGSLKGILTDFQAKKYKDKPAVFFKDANNFLNTSNGNYSVPAERSLVRLVTGSLTALFLGTDAYNVTRLVNDDHKMAKKEKKTRLKQEFGRLGLTVYFTMLTQGVLEKHINKSALFGGVSIAGTVLVSEVLGRLISGVPILPISKEKAKKLAKKEGIAVSNKSTQENVEEKKHDKSKILNYSMLFVSAAILGSFVKKAGEIEFLKKAFKGVENFRKNLTQKEITITNGELTDILKKLDDEGFQELAKTYKTNIAEYNSKSGKDVSNGIIQENKAIGENLNSENKQEIIKLGKDDRTILKPIVENVLLVPYKLAKNVLFLPLNTFKFIGERVGVLEKAAKVKKSDIKAERNAILYFKENLKKDNFKQKVNDRIFNAYDSNNRKDYDTSDLSGIYKLFSSAATSLFLVSDMYNLVMKRSGGEDKDLATQQAKQRSIQRGTQLIYSTYLVKVTTDLFKSFYNRSLGAVMLICGFNQLNQDFIQRLSVGLPMTESTRAKILEKENRLKNSKGLKGKYFRAMSYITGKKQLSEKTKNNTESQMITAFESSKKSPKTMHEFLNVN